MSLFATLAQVTLDFADEAEGVLPGVTAANSDRPEKNFGNFLSGILSSVMVIAALLVFLYLIWAGIEWITAGSDKGKVEKARTRITNAIIGIVMLAATTAIFAAVQVFLGIEVLSFSSGLLGSF